MSWSSTVYYTLAGRRQQADHERVVDCLRGVDWTKLQSFTERKDVSAAMWVSGALPGLLGMTAIW